VHLPGRLPLHVVPQGRFYESVSAEKFLNQISKSRVKKNRSSNLQAKFICPFKVRLIFTNMGHFLKVYL
jgi:hypothetical protein